MNVEDKRPCEICGIPSPALYNVEWKGPGKGFKKVCIVDAIRYLFAAEIKIDTALRVENPK